MRLGLTRFRGGGMMGACKRLDAFPNRKRPVVGLFCRITCLIRLILESNLSWMLCSSSVRLGRKVRQNCFRDLKR